MANSKKRPRTKKPYVKRGEENVDDIKTASADTKTEGCNDPSWYVPAGIDPSLVGSISFNNPVGYPLTDKYLPENTWHYVHYLQTICRL